MKKIRFHWLAMLVLAVGIAAGAAGCYSFDAARLTLSVHRQGDSICVSGSVQDTAYGVRFGPIEKCWSVFGARSVDTLVIDTVLTRVAVPSAPVITGEPVVPSADGAGDGGDAIPDGE